MLLRSTSLCFIFEWNGCWNCMTKITFLMYSYSYVSVSESMCVEMKFSTKQERTYFYMKWCHKIGFVPHFHNFHIRLLLSHQQNECLQTMWQFEYYILYLYVNSTEMVQLQMSFAQCFSLKWPTIPQTRIFTNWPMFFFCLHWIDLIFLHSIRVVSFNLSLYGSYSTYADTQDSKRMKKKSTMYISKLVVLK